MTVYERIEALRKKNGISQGKLEKELNFSNGSISKGKNFTPKPERLQKLADYFNVSVDYLLGNASYTTCDICNCMYDPLDEFSCKSHDLQHNNYMTAPSKTYDFDFDPKYLEEIANTEKLIKIKPELYDNTKTDFERINIYDKYINLKYKHDMFYSSPANIQAFSEYCKQQISTTIPTPTFSSDLLIKIANHYNIELSHTDIAHNIVEKSHRITQLVDILTYLLELDEYHLSLAQKQVQLLYTSNSTTFKQSLSEMFASGKLDFEKIMYPERFASPPNQLSIFDSLLEDDYE